MGLPLLLGTNASRLALAEEGAGPPVRVLAWEAAQLPLAALDRPLRLTGTDAGGCGAGSTAAGISAAVSSAAGPGARDQAAGGSLLLAPGQLARLWLERGQLVVEAANGRSALPAAACYWLAVEAPGGGLGSASQQRAGSAAPEAATAPLAGAPAAGYGTGAGTGRGAGGGEGSAGAGGAGVGWAGASGAVGGGTGGWAGARGAIGGDLQLGERRYRGQLQILPSDAGLRVINHLPLEQYLASVVGSEMPASWPQAALRAQAVAARTYVLRQRKPRALFDVTATTASQVYRGVEAETASTREAVAATRSQVLLFNGGLLDAVFHSSSGGASTENSGEIWNQQLPYLVSVPDLDDLSPVQNWQQTLAPELLRKAFGEIGGALRIEVLTTSTSGRIRQARVTGPSGTLLLSGTQLRSRLGLRSTMVRFESLTLDPATNRPLDQTAQPTWTILPSSLKLAPNNTMTGSTVSGNTTPGNTALGNTAISNSAPSKAMPGNMITGINNSASVPLAGGSATNVSGAINYRSIASGSATSGSLASGATGTASKTALAISPLTASSAAAVAPAGNASQAGIAVGGYIPGMPTSTSLAFLLPPPPLLPAIEPDPLQLRGPTLLAIGRGFGHGVGMSQWGAYGLARRGEDYQRILLHYYRGSELRPYAAALASP